MYAGKILRVNLESREVKVFEPEKSLYEEFVGGGGVAVNLHLKMESYKAEPFSKENPLIIMTGPLTASAFSCSRAQFTARSPLTYAWGESSSGGKFATYLKRAGWDGLIVEGKSDKPVYVYVDSSGAEVKDASFLWGKTTYETQEEIKKDEGDVSVAAIGPAGENLVRYACILVDNSRAAGRTGMGAVMGSKNLKAIAIAKEEKFTPEPKNIEEYRKAMNDLLTRFKESFMGKMLREVGTGGYVESAEMFGDLPVRYFTRGVFGKADKISSNYIVERYFEKHDGCLGCPIKCGKVLNYKGEKYHLPEYETLASYGSLLMIDSAEVLIEMNHLANSLGMDTISSGVTIGMAMYLTEEGIKDFGIKFGEAEKAKQLLEDIAYRRGIGDLLAEGTMRIEEKLGLEGIAAHVRGLEIPMHDPRAFSSLAVAYATNNRGACHLPHQMYNVEMGMKIKEYGIVSEDRFENKGKGIITAKMQNYAEIFNSLVMCVFVPAKPKQISALLSSATGLDYSVERIYEIGERTFLKKREFNELAGRGKEYDKLPKIILQPVEGGSEGNVPDIELQLKEYYEFRGWN
ncbi:Aldehyde ferredoxin oxidoreductase [Ferroglobus placidus DSM 10642]|uniref:Aldehyde ferredoxin oxidoreductase n=1 Tax=Ferroglobus placidus (strain DSM 10642 / AEDII12DO) TaxID=589924 RepID=D3RYS6_FERPA|nr:aldehyde ferredoxin oxidoreductase family protein [Ferroglobus placidus]ADC65639.1 Aldehyde ferredoxin oxidoreductase [Ferroglobus placidus DSM 10642]